MSPNLELMSDDDLTKLSIKISEEQERRWFEKINNVSSDDLTLLNREHDENGILPWVPKERLSVGDIRTYDGFEWEVVEEHVSLEPPPNEKYTKRPPRPSELQDGNALT